MVVGDFRAVARWGSSSCDHFALDAARAMQLNAETMISQRFVASWLAVSACSVFAVTPVVAQLPSLGKQPWIGHYTVFANKRFQFTVTTDGKLKLIPLGEKSQPVAQTLIVPIEITIQEVAADGKITLKQIRPETLTSTTPATDKLEKTTITGKITGDAEFQVFLSQERGVISIGGRITSPGTLKNPLRFAIIAKFPNAYPYAKKTDKSFERLIAGDRIELKYADGKHKKIKSDEKIGPDDKELNGSGLMSVEVDISSYKKRKLEFSTSPEASLSLWSQQLQALHEGFALRWTPDPTKDPEGKARLSFEVK